MKKISISISVVILAVFTATSTISAKDAAKLRIVRTIAITPEGEYYQNPKISPDGSKVVFRGQEGGLFIRNADGTGPMITVLPRGKEVRDYIWSPDSKMIAYQRSRIEGGKRWIDIMIFKTANKETDVLKKKIPPFGFTYWTSGGIKVKRGLPHQKSKERESVKAMNKIIDVSSKEFKKSNEPIVYYDQIDLKHFVIVEDGNGNVLSKTPGYILPLMSPTKDKFLAVRQHTYVLSLFGEILADLGVAENRIWSKDGQLILFQIVEYGGWHNQVIVGSELCVINVDGSGKNHLTDTPDIIEMYPHWSDDTSKITYYDDKTHRIYVSELEYIR